MQPAVRHGQPPAAVAAACLGCFGIAGDGESPLSGMPLRRCHREARLIARGLTLGLAAWLDVRWPKSRAGHSA